MTHRKDNKAFDQVLEVLIENGLEGLAEAMEIIFNEAMKLERGLRSERALVCCSMPDTGR